MVGLRVEDEKLRRIRGGEAPRVLDLFSGCGGFSLGFQQAGFDIVGGVENDRDACKTYAANLHPGASGAALQRHRTPLDITTTSPESALEALTQERLAEAIDVVIGGPPCPAFTRIGRAKLRSVYGIPDAHKHDARAQLWRQYLTYVRALKPVAIVLENVPDILNWSGQNVAHEICLELQELGYEPRYTLLNAAHYGVPQFRQRMFLVALHQAAGAEFEFPTRTHTGVVPGGYVTSGRVARRLIDGLFGSSFYAEVCAAADAPLAPFVSVNEAFSGLPEIDPARLPLKPDLSATVRYAPSPSRGYAAQLAMPAKHSNRGEVSAHACRRPAERDMRIFGAMHEGDEYPQAHARATQMFTQRLESLGGDAAFLPDERAALERAFVPPYSPHKFPNKWWKIVPSLPSRTLTAHLGKDSYSHIHPGPAPRTITVREAARLMGFPDKVQFSVGLNSALRQLGNAVSPLVATRLANSVRACLAPVLKAGT